MARTAQKRAIEGDIVVAGEEQGTPNGGVEAPVKTINLLRLRKAYVDLSITGTTPYIPHRWSTKAKQLMPGHPLKGQVETKKAPHDPEAEATACLYLLGDDSLPLEERLAAPSTAFKSALIKAVGLYSGLTKVATKMVLHVVGEGPEQLVPIRGTLELHEDLPRNANFSVDLRYRFYILDWSAVVRVVYLPSILTMESVASLLDTAGMAGVGDWRPSAPKSETGTFGQWQVGDIIAHGMVEERARWSGGA